MVVVERERESERIYAFDSVNNSQHARKASYRCAIREMSSEVGVHKIRHTTFGNDQRVMAETRLEVSQQLRHE